MSDIDNMDDGLEVHQLIEGEIVAHKHSSSKLVCERGRAGTVILKVFQDDNPIFYLSLSQHAARHLINKLNEGGA